MGNFLVVLGDCNPGQSDRERPQAQAHFEAGLHVAAEWLDQRPRSAHVADDVCVATFARHNGSGGRLAVDPDPRSGGWLLMAGSWVHRDGFGEGDEHRLLEHLQSLGRADPPDAPDPTSSTREIAPEVHHGVRELARGFDGQFVLLAGGVCGTRLLIVTDLFGSYRCHQRHDLPGVFATSGSSFLLASLAATDIDPVGTQELLYSGAINETRTLHRQVSKLDGAHITTFGRRLRPRSQRYWSYGELQPETMGRGESVERFAAALRGASKSIVTNFPRPVCDLTGGYDSRAVLAGLRSANAQPATTVCGADSDIDVALSRRIAEQLSLPHRCIARADSTRLSDLSAALPYTDGEYDSLEYASILRVHHELAQTHDASINGSFGEVARGYRFDLLAPRLGARQPLDARRVARRQFAATPHTAELFAAGERLDLAEHTAEIVERCVGDYGGAPNTFQLHIAYLEIRMRGWQGRIASSTNRVWPLFSPLMFRPVIEAALETRSVDRRRSLLVRRMLADFHPLLAALPVTEGYPAAPMTRRNAHRFWPLLNVAAGALGRRLPFGGALVRRLADRGANAAGLAAAAQRAAQRRQGLMTERDSSPMTQLVADPTSALSSMLDAEGYAAFMQAAARPEFGYDAQWRKLVTIEHTFAELAVATAVARRVYEAKVGSPIETTVRHIA